MTHLDDNLTKITSHQSWQMETQMELKIACQCLEYHLRHSMDLVGVRINTDPLFAHETFYVRELIQMRGLWSLPKLFLFIALFSLFQELMQLWINRYLALMLADGLTCNHFRYSWLILFDKITVHLLFKFSLLLTAFRKTISRSSFPFPLLLMSFTVPCKGRLCGGACGGEGGRRWEGCTVRCCHRERGVILFDDKS